jgi:FkbM family methyltransferase
MFVHDATTRGTQTSAFTDPALWTDVDLIIPTGRHRFMVPASEQSLVPHLLAYRCWEPHLRRFFTSTLQPTHVFMDVGANFGYFTILAAGFVKRVIAFEPAARTHGYCAANVRLNGLTNVELHHVGLWHEDAALELTCDASTLNAAIVPHSESAAREAIEVRSLDGLVRTGAIALPALDVVKMDVEGAELSALQGMSDTIRRLRPTIVMEANRPMLATFGVTLDDVWQFFQDHAYDLRVFEHWQEHDPVPAETLDELRQLCPRDSLTDVVALPRARRRRDAAVAPQEVRS